MAPRVPLTTNPKIPQRFMVATGIKFVKYFRTEYTLRNPKHSRSGKRRFAIERDPEIVTSLAENLYSWMPRRSDLPSAYSRIRKMTVEFESLAGNYFTL